MKYNVLGQEIERILPGDVRQYNVTGRPTYQPRLVLTIVVYISDSLGVQHIIRMEESKHLIIVDEVFVNLCQENKIMEY